jgi:LAO/AO transport system kinase
LGGAADTLREGLLAGNRRALARAVTLAESTHPEDRAEARDLLGALPEPEGTLRIGLTGAPGVGKSTFIEAFGLYLARLGQRLAVLAVDPSSSLSGGSILGDKTRMDKLARHPSAFIRPSPSGGATGGVARRTREVIRLAEAAGHGTVLVETVGVGQSETLVAELTDIFVLLIGPGAGDELQGVKRGIMELADLVLVTKADGTLAQAAELTRAEYQGALRLMRPRPGDPDGFPRVMAVSALQDSGIPEVWLAIDALAAHRRATGALRARRGAQAVAAFRREAGHLLLEQFRADPASAARWQAAEADVQAGRLSPEDAAGRLMDRHD